MHNKTIILVIFVIFITGCFTKKINHKRYNDTIIKYLKPQTIPSPKFVFDITKYKEKEYYSLNEKEYLSLCEFLINIKNYIIIQNKIIEGLKD